MAKHLRETRKWSRRRAREPVWERCRCLKWGRNTLLADRRWKKKVLDMLWIWIVPHRFLCWESICLGCFHWELIGLGGRQPCQWTHLMNSELNRLLGQVREHGLLNHALFPYLVPRSFDLLYFLDAPSSTTCYCCHAARMHRWSQ